METARWIALINVTALMAVMLSMGLQVKVEAVLGSVRQPRLMWLGGLANYGLVPAVTVGLLLLFQTDVMPSAGILILAVCPGAPFGPPLTDVAKGNLPLAVALMLVLAGLSALLSPALLSVLLARIAPESNLHIDYLGIVRTLLVAQLLPLALGLAIHHWAPQLTGRLAKPVSLLANVLLLLLIGLILITQFEMLSTIRLKGWMGMSLLLLSSLGIGWLCGGPLAVNRKTLAVTTASRNAAVGLAIANASFAGTPAVSAVAAYGLFSIGGTLGCALLFGKFAGSETMNAPASAPATEQPRCAP